MMVVVLVGNDRLAFALPNPVFAHTHPLAVEVEEYRHRVPGPVTADHLQAGKWRHASSRTLEGAHSFAAPITITPLEPMQLFRPPSVAIIPHLRPIHHPDAHFVAKALNVDLIAPSITPHLEEIF